MSKSICLVCAYFLRVLLACSSRSVLKDLLTKRLSVRQVRLCSCRTAALGESFTWSMAVAKNIILSHLFVRLNSWLFDRNLWARWHIITVILCRRYSSQLRTIDLTTSFSISATSSVCCIRKNVRSWRRILMASTVFSYSRFLSN